MAKQNQQQTKKPEPQDMAQEGLRPMSLRAFVRNAEQVVQQTKVNMGLKLLRGSTGTVEDLNRQVGRSEGLDQCIGLLKDMLGQIEEAERNQDLPEM